MKHLTEAQREQKIIAVSADEVAEVVDAVTGVTWNTRNMIMEDLFHKDLESHADMLPEYKAPGQL